jgi:PilZ domain
MSAANRALPVPPHSETCQPEAQGAATVAKPAGEPLRTPALKLVPLLRPTQARRFVRVPTYAVGVFPEQRQYPRATLKLPLRLRCVNKVAETFPVTLVTRDISSTGVYFLCPKQIAIGAGIELEIVLVSRPMGRGNVVIATMAHVLRMEPAAMPGWYGIAASFDDLQFGRDDGVPTKYLEV